MGLLTQMSGCALHDNKTRRDRIGGGHFRPTEVTVTFPCDSQECRNPRQPPRASAQAMRDKNIPPCHMTQVRLLWYCPQCADRQRSQYQQNHACIQTRELCELTHAHPLVIMPATLCKLLRTKASPNPLGYLRRSNLLRPMQSRRCQASRYMRPADAEATVVRRTTTSR